MMGKSMLMGKTAILGAFRLEVERLAAGLRDASALRGVGSLKYVAGRLGDQGILVGTMGIGKVCAASATQAAIQEFKPQRIIVCGTAGSLSPEVHALDIVVARDLLQYDSGPGDPKPVAAAPELVALLEAAARISADGESLSVHAGSLLTGDRPVIDAELRGMLYRKYQALAVDMEAAAVAAVCAHNQVPMGALKVITDSADAEVEQDFKKHVKEGASLAQRAVLSLFDD